LNSSAATILTDLARVEAERATRASQAGLSEAVHAVKAYQQRRFARSYEDLLSSPRYAAAARFFLEELYGPRDFSERDAQFARVVPALVRLFPRETVATVATLARLHALSEELDSAMGAEIGAAPIDPLLYAAAWRACGREGDRLAQIDLTLQIGSELDQLTRRPLLRQTLRLMRGPAQVAGLGALQAFLEAGFDTFRQMGGATEFLARIGGNERALAKALFAGEPIDPAFLGQLP
jgi:hypothetical protein